MFMLKFYSGMLSQDMIPLPQLTASAKLRYLKKLLLNKHLQETALVFASSSQSHEEIESAGKQIENIFPQKQLTGLVTDKLKKIRKLQNKIKLDDLEYTAKRGKNYSFSKYLLPIISLRDMHKENLSLRDANVE